MTSYHNDECKILSSTGKKLRFFYENCTFQLCFMAFMHILEYGHVNKNELLLDCRLCIC